MENKLEKFTKEEIEQRYNDAKGWSGSLNRKCTLEEFMEWEFLIMKGENQEYFVKRSDVE